MKRVIVASKNPVKIAASESAFSKMFPDELLSFEGVGVPSGVGDQPVTDEETFRGAMNRTLRAKGEAPEADYWVGLEGGLERKDGGMEAFAWMVALSSLGKIGTGRTSTFVLPPKVAELIEQGMELGEADDIVFGRTNSKQQNGAVGILTGDAVTRAAYYEQAMIMALIPHKHPELYP